MAENIKQISPESTWEIRHQVLWPEKPYDFIKLPSDHEGFHWGIEIDQRLVSVISLFVEENEARFRKFATLPMEQGKGHGTLLLNHVMDFASKNAIDRVWCHARLETVSFYERFEMITASDILYKAKKPYVLMERHFSQSLV